ncbi:MAG: radical SAM protein [Alphaproteobacteria bacterium]
MRTAYVILTDRCNLRCKYCFQEGKAVPRPATGKIGHEVLDAFVEFCAGNEIANAEIFGGEPLLYRTLFEYTVTALRTRLPSLHVGAVTNGTLIDERLMSLIEHGRVNLLVSIDGMKSRHDEMRGGFDHISPWFSRLSALSGVTVALQAGKVERMYDHIKYLWDAGFSKGVFVNVIYNYGWYGAGEVARFEQEYEQALLGMLRGEGTLLCATRLHGLLKQTGGYQSCGIVADGLACNWNGTLYPCIRAIELGTDFSIGDIRQGVDETRNKEVRARIREEVLSSPGAKQYPMVSFCPVAIYQEHGSFAGEWNKQYCEMIQTKAKLVAKYYHEISAHLSAAAAAAS